MDPLTVALSVPPADWTAESETALTEALRAAVSGDNVVVRISIPCKEEPTVAHYTQVCDRILVQNSDVLLTAGRTWKNKQVLEWVFEGYSEKRKKHIAKAIAVAKVQAEWMKAGLCEFDGHIRPCPQHDPLPQPLEQG